MFRIILLAIIISFPFFSPSCNGTPTEHSILHKDTLPVPRRMATDESIPGNFSSQSSLHFDSTDLVLFLKKYDSLRVFRKDLTAFYQQRNYAYAWFDDQGLIEQTSVLYNRVMHIEEEGLPKQLPYLNTYKHLMGGEDSLDADIKADPEKELMITAQYLAFARKAWTGLPESESRKMQWYLPRKKVDYHKFLDSLVGSIQSGQTIEEPVYGQYNLLKNYLKRFQNIEEKGTWLTIKADKKKYQQGDSSVVIKSIRKKLFLAGDLKEDNGSPIFDYTLMLGVKNYQQRYGLKEDGIVGQSLLKEMNAPLSKRIQQIIVNMERCRWIDNAPPGNHLVVNIPQFKLLVYENDSLMWSCNVVVGKEIHKTAIFQGTVRFIVFSPYWNVLSSILNKEIMPKLKRNPHYLESQDMEWYDGRLRQRPGPDNALGKVKFLFPNNFKMYLHDSPSKSLFDQEKRTFSHGCIRVAEARKLALYLLRNDKNWPESKIDDAMNSRKEQTVTLKEPIPVSIVYFTAWVDQQGRINFRDDIYQRDSRLMDAIFAKK